MVINAADHLELLLEKYGDRFRVHTLDRGLIKMVIRELRAMEARGELQAPPHPAKWDD